GAAAAVAPAAAQGTVQGVVWLDFSPGGTVGEIDPMERGLPNVPVQVLSDDRIVATQSTDVDGRFNFDAEEGEAYKVRLAASAFRPAHPGVAWLGPALITVTIMV